MFPGMFPEHDIYLHTTLFQHILQVFRVSLELVGVGCRLPSCLAVISYRQMTRVIQCLGSNQSR